MVGSAPKLRFAPSPNGYLHLGHALSALVVDDWAKALRGTFLLRIEDTDLSRRRSEFVHAIYEDLEWLGLSWEEPVLMQSEHLSRYGDAIDQLVSDGLAYPAPASRSEINRAVAEHEASGKSWPRDPDGGPLYPFADRDKEAKRAERNHERNAPVRDGPAAGRGSDSGPSRLDMDAALARIGPSPLTVQTMADPTADPVTENLDPSVWGDVLLRGRDRPATYHLAVVLDDAFQGITHVVRGKDIEPATSLHRLLQELLGLPTPIYHHHHLIMGRDGRKLSKSEGAKSLRNLRRNGLSAAEAIDLARSG
ncbi:MAG: tRNA glutamyl-Q(34) synthetase GluQRS [Cohaesibacteraceae bacterium]